jgi:hypothetical protein
MVMTTLSLVVSLPYSTNYLGPNETQHWLYGSTNVRIVTLPHKSSHTLKQAHTCYLLRYCSVAGLHQSKNVRDKAAEPSWAEPSLAPSQATPCGNCSQPGIHIWQGVAPCIPPPAGSKVAATTCCWRRDFGCLRSTCCNSTTVMKFSDSNPRATGQVHIGVPRCTPIGITEEIGWLLHIFNLRDWIKFIIQIWRMMWVSLSVKKSSFWGEIWHHHRGKARRHGGAEFDAKECGHRLSSIQINLKYAWESRTHWQQSVPPCPWCRTWGP